MSKEQKQEKQQVEYATKQDIEQLQLQILQLNEACVKDSLRLTYYLNILISKGVFSVEQLEQANQFINEKLEEMRKAQTQQQESGEKCQ